MRKIIKTGKEIKLEFHENHSKTMESHNRIMKGLPSKESFDKEFEARLQYEEDYRDLCRKQYVLYDEEFQKYFNELVETTEKYRKLKSTLNQNYDKRLDKPFPE